MNYYILAFQRFADFSSRSRRSEYWYFVLFNIIASLITYGIDAILGFQLLNSVYGLVALVPSIAIGVRRLHDIGKSGWWLLIGLLPIVGFIILIVWFVQDGEPGDNKWGRNPKEVGSTLEDHLVP